MIGIIATLDSPLPRCPTGVDAGRLAAVKDQSLSYPTNSVWGIIQHAEDGEDARRETAAELPADRVSVYSGAADADLLNGSLRRHGVFSRIFFYGAGSEEEDVKRYAIAARHGSSVVRIDLVDPDEHFQARDILRKHGGHLINYYGRWSSEQLSPP
jgi:hypothetical protein